MPAITAPSTSKPIKLLFVGDSSTGKTGALASLAAAGYNLRILDLDNGCDIFWDLFRGAKAKYAPEGLDRIRYETCTDAMQAIGGQLMPKQAQAWNRMVNLLTKWKDSKTGEDFGSVTKWTPREVLVLDSLSTASNVAQNFHLQLNGKLAKTRTQNEIRRDIGATQSMVESLLQMLYDASVPCNVVVIAHITYVIDDEARAPGIDSENDKERLPQHGYPSAIGKALSPKIPRYFNSVLQAKVFGTGIGAKHRILTRSQGSINLKSSIPNSIPGELPLETGLADFFRVLHGPLPPETKLEPTPLTPGPLPPVVLPATAAEDKANAQA